MAANFLDLDQTPAASLRAILERAAMMKKRRAGQPRGRVEWADSLDGHVLAMIFERPSTRTRVSFEMAMRQLGGQVIVLSAQEMQLGRGETVADTARVLSRYVDGVMLRASRHRHLEEFVAHATVPVINGLTDKSHPCQVMADVLTLEERKGPLSRQIVSWLGDGNNVARSWVHAVGQLGGELRLACPPQYALPREVMDWAHRKGAKVIEVTDPQAAVHGSDCVITDAWVSMHDQDDEQRHNILAPYQVNAALMSQAKTDAIFMHCLPAHRNEEVTDEIMDGPQSIVFDEAENRLHVQKAILLHCFGKL